MNAEQDSALQTYAQRMLEHAPTGMALFDAHELRLLAANPNYYLLLESSRLSGRPKPALGQLWIEVLPPALTECGELFHRVAQTGIAYCDGSCTIFLPERGDTHWKWALEPIDDRGQVSAVLLTITEVSTHVLARQQAEHAHAALVLSYRTMELERQHLERIKTILLSLRSVSEPKAFAQALLETVDVCFSPHLLALYSAHPEQGNLSLLASQTRVGMPQERIVFPLFLSSIGGESFVLPVKQRTPLIKRASQSAQWVEVHKEGDLLDDCLALPEVACAVYLPLWGESYEGALVAAFAKEEAAQKQLELLVQTLSECAPYLAEALATARLNASVAEEQNRLHIVLDQLPEGVLLVEARTGKVSYANPAAAGLLGYALPQLVGVSLNQSAVLSPYGLSSQNQRSAFRWNFALIHALWGKSSPNQELMITRPDGSNLVVLSSAAPIRRSDGIITEAVIVFQDITAAKQLEQQKDTFFAVANHELRTPLTAIQGFAELLQMRSQMQASNGSNLDAKNQYAIENIMRECERLRRLVHDLLDVSLLEHAQLNIEKSTQDLLGPLQQMVTSYSQSTRTHQLHLMLEGLKPTDLLEGTFDLPRIEQVLRNLITNAIKYSPAGGVVEVGVRPLSDAYGTIREALIWVKDQGIGIAASDLPHIFQRFYRATTLEKSISGFGIGLYLARELVRAHKGRIWVESVQGQGSTFFVALPLSQI